MKTLKKHTQDKDTSKYIQCYNELVKETGDIPTVDEVDKRYYQKFGNK